MPRKPIKIKPQIEYLSILDADGNVIPGYGLDDCEPLTDDSVPAHRRNDDHRTIVVANDLRDIS